MIFSVYSVPSVLKLLGSAGEPEPYPHDPRDDQVRALHFRAAVCADGGAAGGALSHVSGHVTGLAIVAADFVDRRRDGGRPLRGDDDEPYHRSALRPRKSAHAHASPRDRSALGWLRMGLRVDGLRSAGDRRVAIEHSRVQAFSCRARCSVFLLVYQTIHVVVTRGARFLPRDVTRGGVDRHRGLARSAHVDSLRGWAAV